MKKKLLTMPEFRDKLKRYNKKQTKAVYRALGVGSKDLLAEVQKRYMARLNRRSGDLYDSLKIIELTASATRIASKVGVGTTFGHSQVYKGATHEKGAVHHHPGGTPYFPLAGGRVVYVKKSSDAAMRLPETKPHSISIPKRSFIAPARRAKIRSIRDRIIRMLEEAYVHA